MRYQLDVIAPSVADVVRSAGGWLFDRTMAGWDVNVLIGDECDARPLQILGVNTLSFEAAFQSAKKRPQPQALAVAADVFTSEQCVQEHVVAVLDHGRTEVTLWGDTWPADLDRRIDDVQHRLSAAARAFKAQALVAAAVPRDPIGVTEEFRGGPRWCPPDDAGLMPVG